MAKRMLIDSTHPEETRVVVVNNGNRLDEFDFETSTKKQIKGNIYLAKITRVEPSLQAAFVDYGGNRHGFLAFSEIHPDYYRIPVGDRPPDRFRPQERTPEPEPGSEEAIERETESGAPLDLGPEDEPGATEPAELPFERGSAETQEITAGEAITIEPGASGEPLVSPEEEPPFPTVAPARIDAPTLRDEPPSIDAGMPPVEDGRPLVPLGEDLIAVGEAAPEGGAVAETVTPEPPPAEPIETIGGDDVEDVSRQRARRYRPYKIQEVIKRRQIMLVQVTKEERGNKGAALTTYLSLAGRYCVLMPNTDRGGGVSRKITNMADRKRLKGLVEDLQIPDGMGVIVRTAGSERSKAEIKRDCEYLVRLWDEIREHTLKSTAPALIYEEGNLIKRSIRDLYARDIDEVIVEGEEGYKTAKSFMRMLMPSHAKHVHLYGDPTVPLFQRYQVETQIDAIHSPVVQLKSGGYIVINQTEALVAIDVNSGRATRERNIEETALKTNCEAADEISRQLRLRDLAGLIVIDFIDMEEHRNQVAVERRLKEAMRHDRARIQVGRISPFGLLELSRQRLRPSIVEASTQPCPHCGGSGHIRSTESTALHVLRAIEEEGMRRRSAEISVAVPTSVALYILNQKRQMLAAAEQRYHFRVTITQDETLIPPNMRLERVRALTPDEIAALPSVTVSDAPYIEDEEEEEVEDVADVAAEEAESLAETGPSEPREEPQRDEHDRSQEARSEGEDGHGRRRRRRRRRGRRGDTEPRERHAQAEPRDSDRAFAEAHEFAAEEIASGDAMDPTIDQDSAEAPAPSYEDAGGKDIGDGQRRRRRRGRRGGRRRRRGSGGEGFREPIAAENGAPETAREHQPERHRQPEASWAPEPEVRPWSESPEPAAAPERAAPRPEPESPALPEAEPSRASEPVRAAEEKPAEPAPAGAVNVSPPVTVTERPANPKRGWWHRLTQS
jgi:ribonuclease E